MFAYTSEKELQDYIIENFSEFFNFKYVSQEFSINNGPEIDLVGEDDNNIYFIELKRVFINRSTVHQVRKYIDTYSSNFLKPIIGIAASLSFKNSAIEEVKLHKDINLVQLKNVFCTHSNDLDMMLKLSEQTVKRINNYRINIGGIPARSTAVRELIELGLRTYEEQIAK